MVFFVLLCTVCYAINLVIHEQKLMYKQIMHCIVHVCWKEIGWVFIHCFTISSSSSFTFFLFLRYAYHKQEVGFLSFQIGHITTNLLSIGWITSRHKWLRLTVRKVLWSTHFCCHGGMLISFLHTGHDVWSWKHNQ